MSSNSRQKAEDLLGQLQRLAMEAMELPRGQRDDYIARAAARYRDDAVGNGMSAAQADAWRDNINEWLHALVDTIETSGGSTGGNA